MSKTTNKYFLELCEPALRMALHNTCRDPGVYRSLYRAVLEPLCALAAKTGGKRQMADIKAERVAAQIDGDFVVFLIGARINKWWQVRDLMWFSKTMPKMLKELSGLPSEETGFLGYQTLSMLTNVQYWRSFEDLEAYARSKDREHFPEWVEFNRRYNKRRGDVGIWHETYLVKDGSYEAIYSGMPAFGLGRVGALVPATGNREAARQRLGH